MKTYFIDIPSANDPFWIQIKQCASKEEAVEYAKKRFGADDEGRICLISELDTDKG